MPINNVLVLGGGMCGVACAIALSKVFPTSSSHPPIKITIYELRPEPSTIGGAVNLTPAAIRCLDILGVLDELNKRRVGCEVDAIQLFSLHTGASLGVMDYTGPEGKGFDGYKGRRILRSEVLQAMLSVAEKIDNIEIVYSKKVIGLEETDEEATVKFEDGTTANGDLVLGCDGIHSATRTTYVEPTRVPSYSGIASASGFTRTSKVIKTPEDKLFFKDTGLSMSRCGAFLTTFFTPDKDKLYLASVIEMKHQADKEGWRAKGKDQDAVKEDMMRRFGVSALPKIKEMLQEVDEWYLYPVFLLPPNGKWATKRVFLLGDAAHAMPPRGESIGYALEDAVIFSHLLQHFGRDCKLPELFETYEQLRRKPIDDAYKDASFGWDTIRDSGWLVTKLMEWITPIYIWWSEGTRAKHFLTDPRSIELPPKE